MHWVGIMTDQEEEVDNIFKRRNNEVLIKSSDAGDERELMWLRFNNEVSSIDPGT